MINRSYLNSLAALCLITIISGFGGLGCGGVAKNGSQANNTLDSPTPTPTPDLCAGLPDDMIMNAIYGQIARDKDLAGEFKQINVTVKAHVVTLYGWVATADQHDKVIDMAKKTYCVTGVNADNFYGTSSNPTIPVAGNCANGYTHCGDICIPTTDHCSISIDPGPIANTKSTGKAGANVNTNGKTKANANANANTNTNTNR